MAHRRLWPTVAMDVSKPGLKMVKEDGASYQCDHCDKELSLKISQLLLSGMGTACVDHTAGLFKGPASSVAVVMRKEMVHFLMQRSHMYTAEASVEGDDNLTSFRELLDNPTDLISVLIDEFSSSKRNLFSRVLGWLSSKDREKKINIFIQEMETNAFWPVDMREAIAAILIINVDLSSRFHCLMKFESSEHLAEHKSECKFRTLNCTIDGCNAKFSALHAERHDLECPFKIVPCEQMCSESIRRRDMDKHCTTVCAMKLIYCPFFQVGCELTFPQCNLEKHCSEFLQSHLTYAARTILKQEASMEELKQHMQLSEKLHSAEVSCLASSLGSLVWEMEEQKEKMKRLESDLSKVRDSQRVTEKYETMIFVGCDRSSGS